MASFFALYLKVEVYFALLNPRLGNCLGFLFARDLPSN